MTAALKDRIQIRDNFLYRQIQAKSRAEAELDTLKTSRMLQLGQTLRDEPLSMKKLARVARLLGAICLPKAAKQGINSLVHHAKIREKNLASAISQPTPYRVRPARHTEADRPRVLHALANFCTGGSSRLVVDLMEHLGNSYEQEVLTSFIPTPPAYVGLTISEIRQDAAIEAFL